MIDIYVGMANHGHIFEILREAERYAEQHSRHFIRAMLYDMRGCYYDTLLGGAYDSDAADDAELQQKLIDTIEKAVAEMELSDFDKLLNKEFKPKSEEADVAVKGAVNPDTFDKGTVSAFMAAGAAIGGLTAVFATIRRFFGRK